MWSVWFNTLRLLLLYDTLTNDEEFGLEMRVRYPEDLGGVVSPTVRG